MEILAPDVQEGMRTFIAKLPLPLMVSVVVSLTGNVVACVMVMLFCDLNSGRSQQSNAEAFGLFKTVDSRNTKAP